MDEKYFAKIYNGSGIRGHNSERRPPLWDKLEMLEQYTLVEKH
jgi:hypothetical protein